MKIRFDWKFAGLVTGLTVGLTALDTPAGATVFALVVCTAANIAGFSDGLQRGQEIMKAKADDFFKQLQDILTETITKAKIVVQHSTQEVQHMRARLAKYEDVTDDRPVH